MNDQIANTFPEWKVAIVDALEQEFSERKQVNKKEKKM
jgi:hypothetical protein